LGVADVRAPVADISTGSIGVTTTGFPSSVSTRKHLSKQRKPRPKCQNSAATRPRCRWAGSDPDYIRYHDQEWGVPVHDDRRLFELLVLEGAQAGLSWITILRKRDAYRAAFDNFNPERVARYNRRRIERMLHNPGIVRNRLKIESAVTNARAFIAVQEEFGRFDRYLWRFVGGRPKINRWRSEKQVPARTKESDDLSDDLRRRGFRFVGSTICYAYMQAVGLVNDHTTNCFRHRDPHTSRRR
jgi:DNA-3-methyladenine glycosylase I